MKWMVMFVILELGVISVEVAMVLDAYVHQVKQKIEEDFDGDDHDRIYQAFRRPHWPGIKVTGYVERGTQAVLGGGTRTGAASREISKWA